LAEVNIAVIYTFYYMVCGVLSGYNSDRVITCSRRSVRGHWLLPLAVQLGLLLPVLWELRCCPVVIWFDLVRVVVQWSTLLIMWIWMWVFC